MAVIGESINTGTNAIPAATHPWPGYPGVPQAVGNEPAYPAGCAAPAISVFLWDCLEESWATGSDPAVNSQAQRLRALNPAMTAHNFAVDGATVSGLAAQAQQARQAGDDYVAIAIGGNDYCIAAGIPGDTQTPASAFRASFENAMQTLMNNNPHKPRVYVSSVLNATRLYAALESNSAARAEWARYRFCVNVTGTDAAGTGATDATRATASALSEAYSDVIRDVCAEFAPYCKFDGYVANRYDHPEAFAWTTSAQDYWHPSIAGNALFAALTWDAGFNWGPSAGPTTADVSGLVYEDVNNNGQRDSGETGINGRTVFFDTDGDGQLDGNEARTSTSANGAWQLTATVIASGLSGEVRTVLPAGRHCSQPTSPGPAHTDCGHPLTLQRGDSHANKDFGT